MSGYKVSAERRAQAVVAAQMGGNRKEIAAQLGVHLRTLKRWEAEAKSRPEFATPVAKEMTRALEDWSAPLNDAIREHVCFLGEFARRQRKALQAGKGADPEVVRAVATSLGALHDMSVTAKVVGARVNQEG